MDGIDRAQRDLDEGRPWHARDRLQGLISVRPTDPAVFDLLGQAYAAMNDLPAAGSAWFLSDRASDDPEVAAAIAALRGRYRRLGAIALSLHVRFAFDSYAPAAQQRLRNLHSELAADKWSWNPPALPTPPLSSRRDPRPEAEAVETHWTRLRDGALVALILLATVGVWAAGVVTLLTWIIT